MNADCKFKALFESNYHSIAFLSLCGKLEDTNSLFNQTFLHSIQHNSSGYLWDIVQTDESAADKQLIKNELSRALQNGSCEFTLEYNQTEYTTCFYHCTLRCYQDVNNTNAGLIFKCADITESIKLKNNLEEIKERYDLSIHGSGDGMWDWKIQEDVIYFSPRFRELMGFPPEEYIGGKQTLMQVMHPDDVETTRKAIENHLIYKTPFHLEHRLQNAHGEYRWFLVRGQALWNAEGKPFRMAGSLTNIHQQKQLEVDLNKAYKLQNVIFKTLPDIVLLVDFSFHIKNIFNTGKQLELIGITLKNESFLLESLPKKVTDFFTIALENIVTHQKTAPFYIELKKGTLWYDFEVHLQKISETEIVCILRDITNARNFEREIRKNELKYTNLLDTMQIGLLEVDNKETVRFATQPFLDLTGYTLNEIVGKNAAELLAVHLDVNERSEIISKRKKGISDQYLTKIKTRKGEIKDILVSASPLANANGNVIGSVGLHIDITEERKKSNFLEKVKAIGKIGTFNIDLIEGKIEWDSVVRSIYEVGDDFVPDIINGLAFYKQGENRTRIQDALKNAIAIGAPSDGIYEIITAKNNNKWVRVVAYVEKHNDIPVNIVGLTLDITHEKLQSIHFEKLKNHYESIASATNEIFFDWHFTDDALVLNDSYFRITEQDRQEDSLTGAAFIATIYPEDQENFKQSLEISIENKTLWETSFRLNNKDAKHITLQLRGRISFDEKGNPLGVIGVMNDVSNIIELQTKLLEQEVKHLKILGETALAAEQSERDFIGQELHDNVAQLLVVAQLHLSYYLTNPEKNEKTLKEGINLLSSTVQEIRKLSHRLTGYSLKQEGITQALDELINSLTNLSPIKFKLESTIDKTIRIDSNKSIILYRVCQELLNNVVKYSKANECVITVDVVNSRSIRLCVKDNGKGFDVSKIKKGVGLNSTVNRVKIYGGTNDIKSSPGNGCEICIWMPL